MGIDGGGSTLRVAIVRDDLSIVAQSGAETASPSIIGHATASDRIREAVHIALNQAQLQTQDIAGATRRRPKETKPAVFVTIERL